MDKLEKDFLPDYLGFLLGILIEGKRITWYELLEITKRHFKETEGKVKTPKESKLRTEFLNNMTKVASEMELERVLGACSKN